MGPTLSDHLNAKTEHKNCLDQPEQINYIELESKVEHYLIKENTKGLFYIDEPDAFPSVQNLIQHYKQDSGGLSTILRCSPAHTGGDIVTATAAFSHS
ncbi:Hypothetical predicted protein [Mytilus galloprovincialis]|uniref:SH2 domain-containing protein n=1 Tax=Mytilus galloprovincialis TaxID=29158 RepID=A0A8B6DIC6_MYTGA|nr:Hypothetical predicted protein [Mytilus galloprovincialis]